MDEVCGEVGDGGQQAQHGGACADLIIKDQQALKAAQFVGECRGASDGAAARFACGGLGASAGGGTAAKGVCLGCFGQKWVCHAACGLECIGHVLGIGLALAEEEVLPAGTAVAELGGFLVFGELPAWGGDTELEVPGLDEDTLALLIEPLKEEHVFEPCWLGEGGGDLPPTAARHLGDAVGGGHDTRVAILQWMHGLDGGLIHLRQGIMEVHAAAGDVAEEISDQLDAHGFTLASEVEHAGDETGYFVREIASEHGGFEAENHCEAGTLRAIRKRCKPAAANRVTLLAGSAEWCQGRWMPSVPVVCAILRRGDLFLLARRPPGKRLGGLWEFPGGKVEPGELPVDALHRELAEELGCTVRVLAEFPAVEHVYEWGAIRLLPFVCELAPGSPEPVAHEHTELAWSTLKDLADYEWAPADLPVLQMLQK